MSLYGALFAGVSALNAQSQSMGMISDNIANVNTIGYKRSEAAFSSLVTAQTRSTAYSPGAVRASTQQRIDQQGIIQQSRSSTDLAISGNGFFIVSNSADSADLSEPNYTRAGSFSEDAQGYLVNTAGKYLMGWPLDADGNIPGASADVSSLVPVNVAFLGGVTRPTTQAEIALNLDAGEVPYTYPLTGTEEAHFTRSMRVYDTLGQAQDMTFRFTHHSSPTSTMSGSVETQEFTNLFDDLTNLNSTATFTTGIDISGAGGIGGVAGSISDGDTFVIELDGETHTITVNNADDDTALIAAINSAFTGTPASSDGGGGIQLDANTPIEIRAGGSQPLTQSELNAIGFNIGITYRNPVKFELTVGAAATQEVIINDGDSASDIVAQINALTGINAQFDVNGRMVVAADDFGENLVVGLTDTLASGVNTISAAAFGDMGLTATTYTPPTIPSLLTPLQNQANPQNWWNLEIVTPTGLVMDSGSINFNGDGSINSATNPPSLDLTNIDWGNGSDPQNITVDLTNFSQYSGDYNVLYTDQNGAELGLRTGITVDRDGTVTARFSNGEQTHLYQLALATFANANGLKADNGNVYIEGAASGEYNLREAGVGGAGLIESGSLEASNVDLADEFSKMIVTQRAYSAGTKVITTSDQMLEELLRLR